MVFTAAFGVLIGLGMIGQWAYFYFSRQIPELEDEPIRIWFHITAEVLTGLSLIVSGIALFAGSDWARPVYLVSLGMLFYTAVISPGYFAQKGEWKWLGIFAVLIVCGLVSLIPVL